MQAPAISGTIAGQSTPSGQTDRPFSKAKIADPNILTSDSLSIQITGGGGKLSDGAGFSGLTESAAGVYLLSGTAAAITRELDALVFTPNPFSATTTFTLTDTTSRGYEREQREDDSDGDEWRASLFRVVLPRQSVDARPDPGRLRHS